MAIQTVTLPSLNPQSTRKQRKARDAFKSGFAHQKNREWQQAVDFYNIALRADTSDTFPALANRGMCYYQLCLPYLALADYARAFAVGTPEQRQLIRVNRAVLLNSVRRYDEALIDLATDDSEGSLMNAAFINLMRGNYKKGLELYHNRATSKQWFKSARKLDDLKDKDILIIHEQGYGDSIQMCRYIPQLKAKSVTWITRTEALVGLLRDNFGINVVVASEIKAQAMAYDKAHVLVMDLWEICNLHISGEPYLRAAKYWDVLPNSIGLCWRGRASYANDHNRTMTLEQIKPDIPARFLSLQHDKRADEKISHIPFDNFNDLAGMVMSLDAVMTVDTAVAHLAGALGVKTALILPYSCDWRWGESGDTTPWYDSIRLFRQPEYGVWEPAIQAASTWLSQ